MLFWVPGPQGLLSEGWGSGLKRRETKHQLPTPPDNSPNTAHHPWPPGNANCSDLSCKLASPFSCGLGTSHCTFALA